MSKQILKILGVLLLVCFLMSTTAAAICSESESGMGTREQIKDKMMGKISEGKGLSECKNIFIRNLIIAKNIIIIKTRAHPLLRAKLLKKGMMGEEGMMGAPSEGKLSKLAAKKIATS